VLVIRALIYVARSKTRVVSSCNTPPYVARSMSRYNPRTHQNVYEIPSVCTAHTIPTSRRTACFISSPRSSAWGELGSTREDPCTRFFHGKRAPAGLWYHGTRRARHDCPLGILIPLGPAFVHQDSEHVCITAPKDTPAATDQEQLVTIRIPW
jgi:hypothetical protein